MRTNILHQRAPTPQALRPLSSSAQRGLLIKNQDDTIDELNGTNTDNYRPQTSKILHKKYQTTRIIMHDSHPNRAADHSMKPPMPKSSAKGLAMAKL